MTKESISGIEALKALLSEGRDHLVLAEMLGFVADRLMSLDADQLCAAGKHARSPDRANHRNRCAAGHRAAMSREGDTGLVRGVRPTARHPLPRPGPAQQVPRGGSRARPNRAGRVDLKIPKLRKGSYFPFGMAFEPMACACLIPGTPACRREGHGRSHPESLCAGALDPLGRRSGQGYGE